MANLLNGAKRLGLFLIQLAWILIAFPQLQNWSQLCNLSLYICKPNLRDCVPYSSNAILLLHILWKYLAFTNSYYILLTSWLISVIITYIEVLLFFNCLRGFFHKLMRSSVKLYLYTLNIDMYIYMCWNKHSMAFGHNRLVEWKSTISRGY